MDARLRDLLSRLLDARAPSGYETPAAAVWREEAEQFADRVWGDVQGNAFAEVTGDAGPTVMLAGHLDEIGLIVNHIDEQGFLWVKPIGGWDPNVLVGQRIDVLTRGGRVLGVVGRRAIHLLEREERDKAVKIKHLWIDIGARDGEEAKRFVRIGDAAVIRSDTIELGDEIVAARSIDDRIGALVALEALGRSRDRGCEARVVAVGTTQEEISYRSGGGASTSSYDVRPDAAIVIDVTHASDHPQTDPKEQGEVKLGLGPVLARGAAINDAVLDGLVETAEAAEIPYQLQAIPSSTGTDADNIYTTRAGVAAAVVSIPNRYMHSPNQLVNVRDVENAAELIAAWAASLTADSSFLPG